jgi:hypothetical protein
VIPLQSRSDIAAFKHRASLAQTPIGDGARESYADLHEVQFDVGVFAALRSFHGFSGRFSDA